MELEQIINTIINNGMAVGICLYFLWRDAKYQASLLESITILKAAVENLKELVERALNK